MSFFFGDKNKKTDEVKEKQKLTQSRGMVDNVKSNNSRELVSKVAEIGNVELKNANNSNSTVSKTEIKEKEKSKELTESKSVQESVVSKEDISDFTSEDASDAGEDNIAEDMVKNVTPKLITQIMVKDNDKIYYKNKLSIDATSIVKLTSKFEYVKRAKFYGESKGSIDITINEIMIKLNNSIDAYKRIAVSKKIEGANGITSFNTDDLFAMCLLLRTKAARIESDGSARYKGVPVTILFEHYVNMIDSVFYVNKKSSDLSFSIAIRKQGYERKAKKMLYSFDRFMENQGVLEKYRQTLPNLEQKIMPLNYMGARDLFLVGDFQYLTSLVSNLDQEDISKVGVLRWIKSTFYENLDKIIEKLVNSGKVSNIQEVVMMYNRNTSRPIINVKEYPRTSVTGTKVLKYELGLGFLIKPVLRGISFSHSNVSRTYNTDQFSEKEVVVNIFKFDSEEASEKVMMHSLTNAYKNDFNYLCKIPFGVIAKSQKDNMKTEVPPVKYFEVFDTISKDYYFEIEEDMKVPQSVIDKVNKLTTKVFIGV